MIKQKQHKCGCGKTYSCASSLSLHIKKNHNMIVPIGTIGGPKSNRDQIYQGNEWGQGMTVNKEILNNINPTSLINEKEGMCSGCKTQIAVSIFFQCQICPSHFLCSNCFWASNNFTLDHKWKIIGEW